MTLPIIGINQRLQETRGVKGCIFGKSGVGKTSLLFSLPQESTLFFDLEAGDLSVEEWEGDAIRPKTWQECRDLTALICGPDLSLRDDQPYSQLHYDASVSKYNDVECLRKYETIFIDSITVAARMCLNWCKGHPQAKSEKTGKLDNRNLYGIHAHEMIGWLTHLQHARLLNIWLIGILDEKIDDFKRTIYTPQIEGNKTSLELPGIVDQLITMSEIINDKGKKQRVFFCSSNEDGYPAKDRSGRLNTIEKANLSYITQKIKNNKRKPISL